MCAIATIADARALGYCARGLRRWFPYTAAGRTITWTEFVAQGAPVPWLYACEDAMAARLAEAACARARREGTHGV